MLLSNFLYIKQKIGMYKTELTLWPQFYVLKLYMFKQK